MPPPAAAVSSRSARYWRHASGTPRRLNTPNVTGRPVSTARSRSRTWYSLRPGAPPPRALEDPGVQFARGAAEPPHFVPARGAARHRPLVRGLVSRRARGREAEGAAPQGVAQPALHRAEIVVARLLLEGALTHHVGAER